MDIKYQNKNTVLIISSEFPPGPGGIGAEVAVPLRQGPVPEMQPPQHTGDQRMQVGPPIASIISIALEITPLPIIAITITNPFNRTTVIIRTVIYLIIYIASIISTI